MSGCGPWAVNGFKSAMVVKCTDKGQRCVVNCGGFRGFCFLKPDYLQLVVIDKEMYVPWAA